MMITDDRERKALGGPALRGYRAADLDAMFELDKICFAAQFRFSRSALKRFVEARNALVVVAESGEELAGFCIVHVQRMTGACAGYVVTLDVAPGKRRSGLATKLMVLAEQKAFAAGCDAMLLHVYDGNAAAVQFYQRSGYELSHAAANFYGAGVDALLYRKALSANSSI